MSYRHMCAAFSAVLLLAFSSRGSYAQEPQVPCLDYFCPESENPFFTGMAIVSMNNYGLCGPDCKAWVTFKHRMACGEICDLYIEKVEFLDSRLCSCATSINGMREAIAGLLRSNSSIISYCFSEEEGCTPALRVTVGGCYRFLYEASYDHYQGYISCGAQICCQSEYMVCRGADQRLTFTQIDFNAPSIPCGIIPPLPDPSFCYSFCESLPEVVMPPGVKTVPEDGRGSLTYVLSGSKDVEIYPNPANGFAVIRCSGEGGTALLEVVSMSGEVVWRVKVERDGEGKLRGEVNLTEFPNGSYSYRILSDGVPLCSGILTVTQ